MITDTDESARRAQLAANRRRTPSERVRIAVEMSEAARQISIEGEMRRHPELTRAQARDVVLRRTWGPALAARVPTVASRGR